MIQESAGIAKKQYLPKHKEQFRQMGIPYYEEMEDKKHDRTHIYNRYTQRSTPDPADHLCPAADHHHRLHTTRHPGNHTHPKKTNPLHPAKKRPNISPFTFHLNIHVFCTGHYKPPLPTNRNPPGADARHTRRPPAPGGFRPPNPMNLLAFAADL